MVTNNLNSGAQERTKHPVKNGEREQATDELTLEELREGKIGIIVDVTMELPDIGSIVDRS